MSNFALTKASAAALGLLCRTAGTDQLLLIQPARELLAEITVEPTGTADHGQIEAVLHLREQRHSITLQRDDGANAQHLAEWVEAAANGTADTALAIPQRAVSAPLLPCRDCGSEAIGYDYAIIGGTFRHGVKCRHRDCQAVEGAETATEAHTAWNEMQAEPVDEPDLAQDEREAPEVVAVLYKSGDVLTAEECGIALEVCAKVETPLMTVAQHERIVAALARPAKTEQHPIYQIRPRENVRDWLDTNADGYRAAKAMASMEVRMLYAAPIAQTAPQHPDDEAVDRFAVAMKAKLAASREKGRHGWQNATAPHLSALLYDHLYKADPLDVGNLAMMLHQNGQVIELPQEARGRKQTAPQPEQSDLVEALEAIVQQYPNPDISHVEYRVHACKQAEVALANYRAAQAARPAA